ncbi:MAG TPA: hypothetical protein VKB71_14635 [Rhizomicrobium sp.]|nr:hypothetical protein [Rhizomicrobium sp.]
MSRISAYAALLAGCLAACSQPIDPPTAEPVAILSAYADKVPGKWLLLVDAAAANAAPEASGTRCSEFDSPLDLSRTFTGTAEATFRTVADDIHISDHPPSRAELASGGYTGVVALRVTRLHTSVKTDGLIEAHASADAEIDASIVVTKGGDRMVESTQSGKGEAERDAKLDCSGAATAVSAASGAAMQDMTRKLAEQFANSHAVRYSVPGLAPQ